MHISNPTSTSKTPPDNYEVTEEQETNCNALNITLLPEESIINIGECLDRKSITALSETCRISSRDINTTVIKNKINHERQQDLREALREDSPAGNNRVHALMRLGATLPPEEQEQDLREAMRMDSAAGNSLAHALRSMGATLSPEEREQALEALNMNSIAGINHEIGMTSSPAYLPLEGLWEGLWEARRSWNKPWKP